MRYFAGITPKNLPFTYCAVYLLIPWRRVLERLTGTKQIKKFPAFYGTRKFITEFTTARHLSLSWARSIQSIPPHPNSWRYILILSSPLSLVLPTAFFPQVSPPKTCTHRSSPPYVLHAQRISFFSIYHPNNTGWAVQIMKLLVM